MTPAARSPSPVILGKSTLIPLSIFLGLAACLMAIGAFVSNVNDMSKAIVENKTDSDQKYTALKNEIEDVRTSNNMVINDVNKQLLYIQIIVSKIATKNNIDIKGNLPTNLQEAITYDP